MNPSSTELDQAEMSEQSANRRATVSEGSTENSHKHVGHDVLCEQTVETTEVGTEAAAGPENTVTSPHRGGDGMRGVVARDRSPGGLGSAVRGIFGEGSRVVVQGNGFVGWWVLVLNNGKDGIDLANSVLDEEKQRQEDDEVEEPDEPDPGRKLIHGSLRCRRIGVLNDGTSIDGRGDGGVLMHDVSCQSVGIGVDNIQQVLDE